jgi:hypothetical protein
MPSGDGDQHIKHRPNRAEQPGRRVERGFVEPGSQTAQDRAAKGVVDEIA